MRAEPALADTPKQLLPVQGAPMISRVRDAIRPHVDEVVLLGDGIAPRDFDGLARLRDAPDVAGPLAGILAALRARRDAAWVIAAADMPRLTAEAVAWLVRERHPPHAAVFVRTADGRVHPFPGIYEPGALGLLEELARTREAAPRLLASHPRTRILTPPHALASAWTSVNTPEEYAAIARRC